MAQHISLSLPRHAKCRYTIAVYVCLIQPRDSQAKIGVSEYDQDFEDGTTSFMCTREHAIMLYQSELLRVLPDRLTSALQPSVGDRRLKELFADLTSDTLRTMIQNTIEEFTTQYVAGLSSDSSSLDASIIDGSPSVALSALEATKPAHPSERPLTTSSLPSSVPTVLEPGFEFFDIDQLIDESIHELKNGLVTSAEQHAQESLLIISDQASGNDLLTKDDARFSWYCDPSQEMLSYPTRETFELTIDTNYLEFPTGNQEDLESDSFNKGWSPQARTY
jgi:hypothetical protein